MVNFLKKIFRYLKKQYAIARLKSAVRKSPIKIVVGSSGFYEKGWTPTDIEYLDMLKANDWKTFFNENTIDAIIGEHVWEHLSQEDGLLAFKNCFKYLRPGGYLRIAVPDGFHPKKEYIDYVKPGGTGNGADDHKILYNYQSMTKSLEQAGFFVDLLEYFDENGQFHERELREEEGFIKRSKYNDSRNTNGELNYTSLIVDAIKP
jgi:predicted SAM-dependent methyltransferase